MVLGYRAILLAIAIFSRVEKIAIAICFGPFRDASR